MLVSDNDYAFQDMDGDRFDLASAESAVRRLATDYKRLLEPEDYRILAEIDRQPPDYALVMEQTRRLLYNLAPALHWHDSSLARQVGLVGAPTKPLICCSRRCPARKRPSAAITRPPR